MGQWQYEGSFGTYSKQVDGFVRWFVQWNPSILYASLKPGYELKIQKAPAGVKGLSDRNGTFIDPTKYPELAGVITGLTKNAVATGATDGQNIIMVDAKGGQLATVTTLTPPIDSGMVKTTLDLKIQDAVQSAVNTTPWTSGMVAIEPSTGHILAIGNHSSEYYDTALLAGRAPGSTFKIITSTALLHNGLTTIDTNVVCPQQIDIQGTVLKNSEGESAYGSTYEEDFAASCNNAFSSFWNQGVTPNMLADTAQTFYGLNQQWDLGSGQSAQYMVVPGNLTNALLAESLVGQGNILSCPLALCSVAATVANGSFKQPILVPTAKQITATPLGSSLQSSLKVLMSSVVSEGTAYGIFPANGHFFAKTGTAETGPQNDVKNDSWFVVFHDEADIALGSLSVDAGYGAAVAAPQCAKVFEALGYMKS
jgi:cell division protein FtsI/penicillin-binding protein 2